MSDMTLYETTSVFRDLLDLMEEQDEDPTEENEKDIQRIVIQQVTKVQDFAQFRKKIDALCDLAAAEIKRLQDRKRAMEHRAEQLDNYALYVMEQGGFDRLDGETASLVIRKYPPAVMVFDQNAVPPEFITVKTEVVVNKTNVGAALKAGREVPGCQLVQGRKVVVK